MQKSGPVLEFRNVWLLHLVCMMSISNAVYMGSPTYISPSYGWQYGYCHSQFWSNYRGYCSDINLVNIGGPIDDSGESRKVKGVVEYAIEVGQSIKGHGGNSNSATYGGQFWVPLDQMELRTVNLTNKTSCGNVCVVWLVTPFGEANTIRVAKSVVGNLDQQSTLIWSTSNDVVYDMHCIGKGCAGMLPTWQKYLNGPLDTATDKCLKILDCNKSFKAYMISDGTSATKYISGPAENYLWSNMNLTLFKIHVPRPNGSPSVNQILNRHQPDLVIIGAAAANQGIGRHVETIGSMNNYRPGTLIAVNTFRSSAEGMNMENSVVDSDFSPNSRQYKQCVAFPIYYDPNGPSIDSHIYWSENAKLLKESLKTNLTKFTAHLYGVMGLLGEGIYVPRFGAHWKISYRDLIEAGCKSWSAYDHWTNIVAAHFKFISKPCRGITYIYAMNWTTGKPSRHMFMSQALDINKSNVELISGRASETMYGDLTKLGFDGMTGYIKGSDNKIRQLTYGITPIQMDLIKNPRCPKWNIFTTTTTTTTSTLKISGAHVVHVGVVLLGSCFKILHEALSW